MRLSWYHVGFCLLVFDIIQSDFARIFSRLSINESFIHRFITRNKPRNQRIVSTETKHVHLQKATRRHFPHTNKFRLTMQQSDKRHWSLEPLQRRRITPNSVKMTRKCAYWTKHRETLHDPYTGNETNDQDFHQLYWYYVSALISSPVLPFYSVVRFASWYESMNLVFLDGEPW